MQNLSKRNQEQRAQYRKRKYLALCTAINGEISSACLLNSTKEKHHSLDELGIGARADKQFMSDLKKKTRRAK